MPFWHDDGLHLEAAISLYQIVKEKVILSTHHQYRVLKTNTGRKYIALS
jgi:hypothetical protein